MTWLDKRKKWLPTPEQPSTPIDQPAMLLPIDLPQKPFFRLGEVAELCEVHIKTVYRWIEEGLLRVSVVGKSKRVSRPDLYAFLQQKLS